MKTKTTAQLLKDAVAEYGKRTPAQRAEDMVARGVVNRKGELTTQIGGSAKPEGTKRDD